MVLIFMKKYIDKVTVTGASDETSFDDMIEIQKEFPFVEWGILLSKRSAGVVNRFPSYDWFNQLRIEKQNPDSKYRSLRLSGHLCGSLVNEFLVRDLNNFGVASNQYLTPEWFDRIQINTHGEKTKYDIDAVFSNVYNNPHIEFIAQYDKVNDYIHKLHSFGVKNISALYDLSHGAGVLPKQWDSPLEGIRTGYAGGLSVDNLEEQLLVLDGVIGDTKSIWIDAETWLRTNDKFDLNLVVKFLEIAKSRVV